MKLSHQQNIFKNILMFCFGIFFVVLATQAFNVVPVASNAVIFIKSIFLTSSGTSDSSTGVVLEGSGGNARFKGNISIDALRSKAVLGTDEHGKIVEKSASDIYNFIGEYITPSTSSGYRESNGDSIFNTNHGNVGIGIDNPQQALQVYGNILGGALTNSINSHYSTIAGGENNILTADNGFIGGGRGNRVNSEKSSIGGGEGNQIIEGSNFSSIVGGNTNTISVNSKNSFIGGGEKNNIINSSIFSSIVGGDANTISKNSEYCFVGGGKGNGISTNEKYSSIVGGIGNSIQNGKEGTTNIILGGEGNSIGSEGIATNSIIAGGYKNSIVGKEDISSSFAAGYQAQARHSNVFIRNSDRTMVFESKKAGDFLINVNGKSNGVGINTNEPKATLDVNGEIRGSYFTSPGPITALSLNLSYSVTAGAYIAKSGETTYAGITRLVNLTGSGGDSCTLTFTQGLLTDSTCP